MLVMSIVTQMIPKRNRRTLLSEMFAKKVLLEVIFFVTINEAFGAETIKVSISKKGKKEKM